MLKTQIIDTIIDAEGGYVNDDLDSGGETNFGVTEFIARRHGYVGDMIDMRREFAFKVYAEQYWHSVAGDQLVQLSEPVAREVVDTCVNCGSSQAGKFLQRALNVLTSFENIVDDGVIGPVTLSALCQYLAKRDERTLVMALNALQGTFYIELATKRPKDKRFIYGWLNNRVMM